MSRGTAAIARSGRRIAASLAAGAARLLGSWYLLSAGAVPEPPASAALSELPAATGGRAAEHDPAQRPVDFDPHPDRVTSQPRPLEPRPDMQLTPERQAWLADPNPGFEVDPHANMPIDVPGPSPPSLCKRSSTLGETPLARLRRSPAMAVQATFADGKLLARIRRPWRRPRLPRLPPIAARRRGHPRDRLRGHGARRRHCLVTDGLFPRYGDTRFAARQMARE